MSTFSLVIEYLTGYAVATDSADRKRAEWPPHPARVYMALAAAHFESGGSLEEKHAERAALEWLAELPPPDVTIPESWPREVLTVYVPVNDQPGAEALLNRLRKPRYFPREHIGSQPLRHSWHVLDELPRHHLDALESICRKVTRIGHSSSLVWARVERNTPTEPTHVPDEISLNSGMRIVQAGAIRRLEDAFNESAIDEFAASEREIDAAKGTTKKALKVRQDERFPRGRPTSQRPVFSISRGYKRVAPSQQGVSNTLFDPNFVVLREGDDAAQAFGLESTPAITQALRGLLMSESRVQPVPSWVSGHEPDGSRLASGHHLALIPLAFVGREHADGHLMGLGIVLPRSVSPRERANVLAPILFDEQTNQPRTLELRMGRAGVWNVVRDSHLSPRHSLRTETYATTSRTWASVTPVLLDRMPKADRVKDPCGWREHVARIVSQSCKDIGLPEPISVRTEKTPLFRGSLRAMPGQGGFAQLRTDKHQVHVAVEFEQPVQGPVLLGAGRFRGYGLMRPWTCEEGG